MKNIQFRPLRRIKKTGKVTVASYMQWRKVWASDHTEFNLIVENEYATIPNSEYVYDHKGEQLFWFNHQNPESLPKNEVNIELLSELLGDEMIGEKWKFEGQVGTGFHHSVRGFDCDGVPVFSHYTSNYIATHYTDIEQFEPLTVKMVVMWLGRFLYQLQKSNLTITNPSKPLK